MSRRIVTTPLLFLSPGLVLLCACFLVQDAAVHAGEAEFRQVQLKVEQDVLEFRDRVEAAYENRCETSNMEQCFKSNYHGCLSSFPSATCPAVADIRFADCGDGTTCSSLVDFTTSSIRYPPLTSLDGSIEDLDLVESTCFSQNLDEYFVQKRDEDAEYWSNYGVDSPKFHFSADTGMFRIYPARPDKECFTYDPRIRPFYVAASSGPKNVLLLLDTSGSMDGLRMQFMKEAAERVVNTLTVGDRVALIPFSTDAEEVQVGSQSLMTATNATKELLKEKIRSLEAVGATNFYDAFRLAFEIMGRAIPDELIVNCNTAVLFLTDGKMTDPPDMTEFQVRQYIENGLQELEQALGHPLHLFTYSISENEGVHTFPKELACGSSTQGVWSKIVEDEDIVASLSSYYKKFALGLGEGRNNDFTAWVEPYPFFNSAIVGTTVSAPVFDRTVEPPVFIGVVGVDFSMRALDTALEVDVGSTDTFDLVVKSSIAVCPILNISECQLESFRQIGPAGAEASCPSANCTKLVLVESQRCSNQDDFPTSLLANFDTQDLGFEDRLCCVVNTSVPSRQCHNSDIGVSTGVSGNSGTKGGSLNAGLIAGISVAVTLVILVSAAVVTHFYCNKSESNKKANHPTINTQNNISPQKEDDHEPFYVLPPPMNPHASNATAPPAHEDET